MSESLIPSFLVSDVSESLRSLTKNEWCERIAQVAHQKWANEWIGRFFERITHLLNFGQNMSDSLGKLMSEFPALSKGKESIKNHNAKMKIKITLFVITKCTWKYLKKCIYCTCSLLTCQYFNKYKCPWT